MGVQPGEDDRKPVRLPHVLLLFNKSVTDNGEWSWFRSYNNKHNEKMKKKHSPCLLWCSMLQQEKVIVNRKNFVSESLEFDFISINATRFIREDTHPKRDAHTLTSNRGAQNG